MLQYKVIHVFNKENQRNIFRVKFPPPHFYELFFFFFNVVFRVQDNSNWSESIDPLSASFSIGGAGYISVNENTQVTL